MVTFISHPILRIFYRRPTKTLAQPPIDSLGFAVQSISMDTNWAAEHLQTIRTLMERSTVYRRALAPIMTFNGILGLAAAGTGIMLRLESPFAFTGFWMAAGTVGVAGSFVLARRQALKDSEPFWSPPTRRVAQALIPSFLLGLIVGLLALRHSSGPVSGLPAKALELTWLPLIWTGLYGCALHAAGFFMPRGMKIFGLVFVAGSSAICLSGMQGWVAPSVFGHGVMGGFFGLLHLAYGIYLYFTEPKTQAA
jgi:hypothetical protein